MRTFPSLNVSFVGAVLAVPVLFVVAYYGALWNIHGFDPHFLEIDACVNSGGIWIEDRGCDGSASLHPAQDRILELIRSGETMQMMEEGVYLLGDVTFTFKLQPSINNPVPSFKEGDWYGILVQRGEEEEPFLRYSRPVEDGRQVKMNPVDIYVENGQLVVALVDDRGAGSGEGNLLRIASSDGGWTWGMTGCFYYTPEIYAKGRDRLSLSKECLTPYIPGLTGFGPEELSLKTTSYAFDTTGERVVCTAKGSYPVIEPTSGLSEDTRNFMNTQIAARVVEVLSGFGDEKESAADPSTAAQAFVGSCKSFFDNTEDTGVNPEAGVGWYSTLSTETAYNKSGYISLIFTHDFYTGGAHPNRVARTLVFSLETGKELSWKDWMKKERVIDTTKVIAQNLLQKTDEEIFSDELAVIEGFLSKPTYESAERFLSSYGEYVPTEKGIRALFDPYEITPYASGPIEFTVPRTELEGMILF